MSLFDIDKNEQDRSKPGLGHHDNVIIRPAHATHSINYVTDASDLVSAALARNGEFLVSASGTLTTSPVTIAASGAGAVTGDTTLVATVAHGLPFTPIVEAYYTSGSLHGQLPMNVNIGASTSAAAFFALTVFADNVGFYFRLRTSQFGTLGPVTFAAVNIRYYLFRQAVV